MSCGGYLPTTSWSKKRWFELTSPEAVRAQIDQLRADAAEAEKYLESRERKLEAGERVRTRALAGVYVVLDAFDQSAIRRDRGVASEDYVAAVNLVNGRIVLRRDWQREAKWEVK